MMSVPKGWSNVADGAGRATIHNQRSTRHVRQTVDPRILRGQPAAETAALALKDSGVAGTDAIGILVLDETGNVVVDKVGATSVAAGVGADAALLVVGPYFLGVGVGTAVVGGGIGMAGGAVGGSMHHKGVKLNDEDKARIAADLSSGKATVGVLGRIDQGPSIQAKLTESLVSPRPTTWWTRPPYKPRRPRAEPPRNPEVRPHPSGSAAGEPGATARTRAG